MALCYTHRLSVIVSISQTPFDIPIFWTNKILKDFFDEFNEIFAVIACCCCGLWIGDANNFGRWIAVMYRFVVSLTFSTIITHINRNTANDLQNVAIYLLLSLTLVLPFLFSWFNAFIVTSNLKNGRALTLDRNIVNLVASRGLNEVEDLELFGMNIRNIGNIGNMDDIDNAIVFNACENGDIDRLQSFATVGMDFSVTNVYGDTPLIVATRNNQAKVVEFLLSQSTEPPNPLCDINQSNIKTGQTVLMIGARCKDLGVIHVLLDPRFGVNPNAADNDGKTAIMEAARCNNIEYAKILLSHADAIGLDVNLETRDGNTAVSYAAMQGNIRILQMLLSHGANLSNDCEKTVQFLISPLNSQKQAIASGHERNTKDGSTALIECARKRNFSVAKQLLEKFNAQVNLVDDEKRSALHYSTMCVHGNSERMLRLLLLHGADANMKDRYGYTAFMAAAANGNVRYMKILTEKTHRKNFDVNVKSTDGFTALLLCAWKNRVESLQYLVDTFSDTIDINVTDNNGYSALIYFIKHNNIGAVRILLSYKTYVKFAFVTKTVDSTAAHFAANKGFVQILKLFANHKIYKYLFKKRSIIHNDRKWQSILGAGAESGNVGVVKFLIETMKCSHVDENVDGYGTKAIIIAAQLKHVKLMKYLIGKLCNCNLVNVYGSSALHWCARSGNVGGICLLVKHGVNEEIKNKYGNTAIMEAAASEQLECFEILKQASKNFDPNARNKNGMTMLIIAAAQNKLASLEYLLHTCSDTIDINATDNHGWSALVHFIKHKNIEAVHLLLSYSTIELEFVNDVRYTNVVYSAAEAGSVEILKLLANYRDSKTLFDKKRINKRKWMTVLGAGVLSGNLEVVKFLIETMKCSDVDENVDEYGNKAIMFAAFCNSVELMKYLIDKSSKSNDEMIHQMNKLGQTPFLCTGRGNAVETMKYLWNNYEIDVNMKDKNGYTILMFGAKYGSIDIIKYLVSNEKFKDIIDINAQSNDGETALSLAIEKKFEECVEFLNQDH